MGTNGFMIRAHFTLPSLCFAQGKKIVERLDLPALFMFILK